LDDLDARAKIIVDNLATLGTPYVPEVHNITIANTRINTIYVA